MTNKKALKKQSKKDLALKPFWEYETATEYWDAVNNYIDNAWEGFGNGLDGFFGNVITQMSDLEKKFKEDWNKWEEKLEHRVYNTESKETNDSYIRTFEVKGFEKNDAKTDYDSKTGMLSVLFEKKSENENDKAHSKFEKQEYFDSAKILADGIKAAYDNNVLTVTIPKNLDYKEPVRNIEIKID